MRLRHALESVTPESVGHFFRLAAAQIRREIIDLGRHYSGPQGLGANYASHVLGRDSNTSGSGPLDAGCDTNNPARLAEWTEMHEKIEKLPDDLREAFDLLYYQELTLAEAAAIAGVSERTIRRRYQEAKLSLSEALNGGSPQH
jgi:RNA polymerase sigma-70 factor (ECF subfamily)